MTFEKCEHKNGIVVAFSIPYCWALTLQKNVFSSTNLLTQQVSTFRLTAFNNLVLIYIYFAQNHQLLEKSDVKLTSFCNFHFNFPQLTSLSRKILFKSAVKNLTSGRLTKACENDNVLWSHYATSLQWDSISHKNKSSEKVNQQENTSVQHPSISKSQKQIWIYRCIS